MMNNGGVRVCIRVWNTKNDWIQCTVVIIDPIKWIQFKVKAMEKKKANWTKLKSIKCYLHIRSRTTTTQKSQLMIAVYAQIYHGWMLNGWKTWLKRKLIMNKVPLCHWQTEKQRKKNELKNGFCSHSCVCFLGSYRHK